jgi:exonuclease III
MDKLDSIKIASLNCRGLNINKLYQIKDLMVFHDLDILLLQETHISSKKESKEIEIFFNEFKCFFPLSENKTKGVGVILLLNAFKDSQKLLFLFLIEY